MSLIVLRYGPEFLIYAIGYSLGIFGADLIILPIRRLLYLGYEEPNEPNRWRPRLLGWLERALYVSTILMGLSEFVAVWLAIKVAEQWDRWKLDVGKDAETTKNRARVSYTSFLIGNALSILCAGLGALFIQLSVAEKWVEAGGAVSALALFSLIIFIFGYTKTRSRTTRITVPTSSETPTQG